MQKITPVLWFDKDAEEAARLYVQLFAGSRIDHVTYAPPGAPGGEGKALTVQFTLAGQGFIAFNGGQRATFSDAVSFSVDANTQEEIDGISDALIGETGQQRDCSWLTDRFGVRWQIVPSLLGRYLGDPDRERAGRVMRAMMTMQRIDIAALERAYHGD